MRNTDWCSGCGGEGRLDEERTCDVCDGDGLNDLGRARKERAEIAGRQVFHAEEGGGIAARRAIVAGRYSEAARFLRDKAARLIEAAELLEEDGDEMQATRLSAERSARLGVG